MINNTPLTSSGSLNYGLYSAGTVANNADINYGSGIGNIGIYSTNGGSAVNNKGVTITVELQVLEMPIQRTINMQ